MNNDVVKPCMLCTLPRKTDAGSFVMLVEGRNKVCTLPRKTDAGSFVMLVEGRNNASLSWV